MLARRGAVVLRKCTKPCKATGPPKTITCNQIWECVKLGVNQTNIVVYLHAMGKFDETNQPVCSGRLFCSCHIMRYSMRFFWCTDSRGAISCLQLIAQRRGLHSWMIWLWDAGVTYLLVLNCLRLFRSTEGFKQIQVQLWFHHFRLRCLRVRILRTPQGDQKHIILKLLIRSISASSCWKSNLPLFRAASLEQNWNGPRVHQDGRASGKQKDWKTARPTVSLYVDELPG